MKNCTSINNPAAMTDLGKHVGLRETDVNHFVFNFIEEPVILKEINTEELKSSRKVYLLQLLMFHAWKISPSKGNENF